jgi:hypothetical protein
MFQSADSFVDKQKMISHRDDDAEKQVRQIIELIKRGNIVCLPNDA